MQVVITLRGGKETVVNGTVSLITVGGKVVYAHNTPLNLANHRKIRPYELISQVGLTETDQKKLKGAGILTVGQLTKKTLPQLASITGIYSTGAKRIRERLRERGLSLRA